MLNHFLTICSGSLKAQSPYVYLSLYNLIDSDLSEVDALATSLAGDLLGNAGKHVDYLLYFLTIFGQPC